LIIKALLRKIFSAFHKTSGEIEAQSINSRHDRQRISEGKRGRIKGRIKGKVLRESIRESIRETYSSTSKNLLNTREAITKHEMHTTQALSSVLSCTDFTQHF